MATKANLVDKKAHDRLNMNNFNVGDWFTGNVEDHPIELFLRTDAGVVSITNPYRVWPYDLTPVFKNVRVLEEVTVTY